MLHKLLRASGCAVLSTMACLASFAQAPSATERVLYSFTGGNDGSEPGGKLAIDSQGNIFGSTFSGGTSGKGVIFRTRVTSGIETVLYNFQGAPDGAAPDGPLTLGPNGAIYGTTVSGGNGWGVVFQLTPNGGTWNETILHSFQTGEGLPVQSGVILDKLGNLYGETAAGGGSFGTIYELRRTASGYKYVLLY